MIKKYRKKPVIVEAVQVKSYNWTDIKEWCRGKDWENDRYAPADMIMFTIQTLEGNMAVQMDDRVIKGVKGEFYPCKPDIFKATYEDAN